HVSPSAGLKTLQPHVSTHGKAYVYAIENMVTGLLFGVRHDDFDFSISTDENKKPIVYECYPGAFQRVYQGKSCSVYEVGEEGFQRGMTSWSPELVSENEVPVINEIVVADLHEKLLEEEKSGNLQICRYEYSEDYRKKIASHVVDRILRFDIDLEHIAEQDERFSLYYKGIVEALLAVTDGHLLP
ncbi:MAG: hypothetical protein K2N94_16390, partial [Lachnospiraceae bacterium]|nr:hypothetical protein [Lachnospiraceae bacterium]